MNSSSFRRVASRVLAAALVALAAAVPAAAQSLNLVDSSATVLRGGTHANTNFSADTVLSTRASSDSTYVRRVAVKFDTHNTIPANAAIVSATLALTIAGGNPESRVLTAYRVSSSYEETQATWNRRNSSVTWSTAGGDTAEAVDTATVTNAVGNRVLFNVTALVRAVVNGTYGSSRYSRVMLVDSGASSRDSYKEFYSDEAGDAGVRPTLTVVLGTGTTTPTEPAPAPGPTGTSTLKVLDWNIHHGVGADGVYNIDRQATFIASTSAQVVSLNEVERYTGWGNEDQPARFAALLKSKTGKTWYFKFAQSAGATNGHGNLVLSTLPFQTSGTYLLSHGRSVAYATIIVNGRNVTVSSTHLDAESSTRRSTQIGELTRWMAGYPQQRIVAGDFNAWPGATEITLMTSGHYDLWAEAKKNGTAVAYAGNEAGNTRNSRIDYVWLSKAATSTVIKGARVFDARDPTNNTMLSDHRPLMATFEIR